MTIIAFTIVIAALIASAVNDHRHAVSTSETLVSRRCSPSCSCQA